MRKITTGIILGVLLLAVAGCSDEPLKADLRAAMACDTFREQGDAFTEGEGTVASHEAMIRAVAEHAQISEVPGLEDAAEEYLAAFVELNDDQRLADAVTELGRICKSVEATL